MTKGFVRTIVKTLFFSELPPLKPDFTEEEIEQLYRQFMEYPSGAAKKKLHVVYLKVLGLPHQEIAHIARVNGDSVTRYLQAYIKGGVTALCASQYYCSASALLPHRESLKIHFQAHPPHTVAQASHSIEKLTGIKLVKRLPRLYASTSRHEMPQNGGDPLYSRPGPTERVLS